MVVADCPGEVRSGRPWWMAVTVVEMMVFVCIPLLGDQLACMHDMSGCRRGIAFGLPGGIHYHSLGIMV